MRFGRGTALTQIALRFASGNFGNARNVEQNRLPAVTHLFDFP
jgi:hypothetical protein